MNSVKSNDLQVLNNYTFTKTGRNTQNKRLLGLKWVKKGGQWTQQLSQIDRQNVTCWTLFLSLFGIGKLAHTTVSLNKICSYLTQYQWENIKLEDQNQTKAFETVCHLANLQLQHQKVDLFKKVSILVWTSDGFKHYWHPALNGRLLLDQYCYQFPNAKGLEIRFKDTKIPVPHNQKLTQQDLMNIEIGFRYELITETEIEYNDDGDRTENTIYHYHYAPDPYYQVDEHRLKLPQRRYLLVVPNKVQISPVKSSDLQVLADYAFVNNNSNKQNNQLLGLKWIKQQGKWTQQLSKVDRQNVTCWTLFLKFFGKGKLAHTSVSLNKICFYLSQYQWQNIKFGDQNQSKAFESVCHLANRQLRHQKVDLFKRVSELVSNDFNHYWNPSMQGRFLLDFHRYQLPRANDIELRFRNSHQNVLPYQKLTLQDLANIEVGYSLEKMSSGDNHYYRYPKLPYYQTNKRVLKGRRKL